MPAQGGLVPVSLLEIQPYNGPRLYFSDTNITAPSLLSTFDLLHPGAPQPFVNYLLDPPVFSFTGSLVTQQARASIQNISGTSVTRDQSLLFSKEDLIFALWIYRLWSPTSQTALITTQGTVSDAEIDDTTLDLTLTSWLNFAKIAAPPCEINTSCQNTFGSQQCGSTSSTNCLNSYGNCTQINRFKGLVQVWNPSVYDVSVNSGVAQPVPPGSTNTRRPS